MKFVASGTLAKSVFAWLPFFPDKKEEDKREGKEVMVLTRKRVLADSPRGEKATPRKSK